MLLLFLFGEVPKSQSQLYLNFLVDEFVFKVKAKRGNEPITVLDLGSGKGGDLKKWGAARVHKVILAGKYSSVLL